MRRFGVREEDLIEKFIRSSGPGGQKANKTATCVYLKHVPTGFEVKMQKARSQALNRFLARRELVRKIESHILGKESEEERRREKIRRAKRRRSKKVSQVHLKVNKQDDYRNNAQYGSTKP